MKKEIFILTTEPPEIFRGMEGFVRQQVLVLEQRGYAVSVFHRRNCGLAPSLCLAYRMSRSLPDAISGWAIGNAAQRARHGGGAAVISHGLAGWYRLRVPDHCKQIHFCHGTYRVCRDRSADRAKFQVRKGRIPQEPARRGRLPQIGRASVANSWRIPIVLLLALDL